MPELRLDGFGQPGPLQPLLHWMIGTGELSSVWNAAAGSAHSDSVFDRVLELMGVRVDCAEGDLARLPDAGPVVIVANHPHGLLDGLVMASIMRRRRRDFKLLANSLLSAVPGLEPFLIPVDVFGGSTTLNGSAARAAVRFLSGGGAVIAFPAGEVSAISGVPPSITDRRWSNGPLKLASLARARVVPAHVSGHNSFTFQLAGLAHPGLRTLLLGRELLNKRGYGVSVTIGRPVPAGSSVERVRRRTYMLGARGSGSPERRDTRPLVPVAPAADAREVESDLERLPASSLLYQCGEYSVYAASAAELPSALHEIGRLREETFRAVGEGTGRSLDLDRFDTHYTHLFLWRRDTREIVGGYRLADAGTTIRTHGAGGLYTSTLFRFGGEFLRAVTPGAELGRSFVRPEYQKRPQPLFYLWRGIGEWLARNPTCRFLFGPVSISDDYLRASRRLIVRYFRKKSKRALAVAPRHPLWMSPLEPLQDVDDLDELSGVVADLEVDGKGLPVLLRHYLALGAEVVEFNVDPEFSNALDALVVVDMLRAPRTALERYMGREQFAAWLASQALSGR